MKVLRIVANVASDDVARAQRFYGDVLGLDLLMDLGWIRTYGSSASMQVQVAFASDGGDEAPVPHLSIEVDDVDGAYRRMREAGFEIARDLVDEPWGVRRFFVRDPFDRLVNVLSHR